MVVAYTFLFGWILVGLALFAFFRPPVATALSFLVGTLLLPEKTGFDLPILPIVGKQEMVSMTALVAAYVFAGAPLRKARLGRGPELLLGVGMVGVILSVLTNMDSTRVGPELVPGTGATDFVSDVMQLILRWGIPFFLGRAMFTRRRDARLLLLVLAVAGVAYSFPIMIELQISPQLHKFLYGFHQHSFAQSKRGDGYRPMVFMAHGLNLSLFMVMCTAAAAALWRTRQTLFGVPMGPVTLYLGILLVACKSTGSILYGILIAPLVLLAPPRLQVQVACVLALIVFSYPILRSYELLPLDTALELAQEYTDERRVHSLNSRLYTEQTMLERITERPLFGWASAGRSAIRNEETGELETTYDGYWIIVLAKRGIVGYGTLFAMLLFPVFMVARALPRLRSRTDRQLLSALSLMIVINVFDLLPNSTVEGYLTLLSGAVAGLVPGMLREQEARRDGPAPASKAAPRVASLLGPSGPAERARGG